MENIPEAHVLQGPREPALQEQPGAGQGNLDEKWLEHFYKEGGREVTLAYTTLNQMKNWAMLVGAAALSGLAFGKEGTQYPTPVMFAGTVVVYTFVLRFYIRAIVCYINLVRWNLLQNDCIQLKLVPKTEVPQRTRDQLALKFAQDIQDYYFEWLSPLDRKKQLLSNLRLGFALLFGLSLFFLIWGAFKLWSDHLVKGLVVFAVLNTILEFNDFLKNKLFDRPERWAERKKKIKAYEIFPIPSSRGWFLTGWIFNVAVSLAVAFWPEIKSTVGSLFCCLG